MASEISSQKKIESPLAIKWTIPEAKLAAYKDSFYCYDSEKFECSNIPGVKYFLRIYPNGDVEARRSQTWIFLCLELGTQKKVKADYKFICESAGHVKEEDCEYNASGSRGENSFCKTPELFDPEKKFIIDGKFTVRCEGILKVERENGNAENEVKWGVGALGRRLWNGKNKDFTVLVGEKSIQVHKCVLADSSAVFQGMFDSKLKEVTQSKIKIIDFSFEIVEVAIQLLYDRKITSLTVKEKTSVLQFLDKYEILNLKHSVEASLLNQISVSTVSSIANASLISNSIKLQQKCIDFIVGCSKKGICIKDLALLDTEFAMKIFENTFYTSIET